MITEPGDRTSFTEEFKEKIAHFAALLVTILVGTLSVAIYTGIGGAAAMIVVPTVIGFLYFALFNYKKAPEQKFISDKALFLISVSFSSIPLIVIFLYKTWYQFLDVTELASLAYAIVLIAVFIVSKYLFAPKVKWSKILKFWESAPDRGEDQFD